MLRKLRLGSCRSLTSKGVIAIANYCPCLTYLNLDQCDKVNDDCLEALTSKCQQIECLSLSACDVTHKKLDLLGQVRTVFRNKSFKTSPYAYF